MSDTPTTEESSAVPTQPKTYCRETAEMIKHWNRRERYRGAIVALRDTLARCGHGHDVPPDEMRAITAELLDALLDMETHGGTR